MVGTPSTGWWGGGTPSTWRERNSIFLGCGGDSTYREVGRGHSIYVEREKLYLFRVWWECGGDSIYRVVGRGYSIYVQ